jgi:hypothetical protein
MADLYGKDKLTILQPVTADRCKIQMDGKDVGEAIQFSLEYSQGVTRRRSIGSRSAVIYASQPTGRATMARLITVDGDKQTGKGDSWLACKGGTLDFTMKGNPCGDGAPETVYKATGCIVTSFSIQASAEDTTVMDNVVIEFLELLPK